MVVQEGRVKKYEKIVEAMKLENVDLPILTLSEFRDYAAWESSESWDRYDFAHVQVLVDKTKEIKKMCVEKGKIPKDAQDDFVARSLDGYINAVFRSVKCYKNKNFVGARLEAATAIPYLLDVVFGIHGRIKPFPGYLEKELDQYPLEKFPWKKQTFLRSILGALNGEMAPQQKMLKDLEKLTRKEGFSKTLDAWEGKDRWAMTTALGRNSLESSSQK